MIAAPSLHREVSDTLLSMEDSLAELLGAKAALAEAMRDAAAASHRLAFAEAQALADGIEGKNEAARQAALKLKLQDEHEAVFTCEAELSRKKLSAEVAFLQHQALRYKLRAFEVLTREA